MNPRPVTKSQRITNGSGGVVSGVDLDPWGGETNKSFNLGTHSRKYTTYDRDLNGDDEAQQRKYKGNLMRFTQPDPFDGSASLYDPQSLNRYAYVGNDPVNFVDPSGLLRVQECTRDWWTGSNGETRYSSWRCVTVYDDGGGKEEFGPKDLEKYEKERREALDKLRSEKCQKFLAGKNISVSELTDAVNRQRPYNGRASSISRLAAGVVGPGVDLSTAAGASFANASISNDFTATSKPPNAKTAILTGPNRSIGASVADRSDVYYDSPKQFGSARIVHEALHSLLAATDPVLAARLGVKVTPDNTSAITGILRKNGCGD